ncbi:UDP-N-acetylmuramyl pentapeptide phosphotransferase [Microbacterium album]|uniref:UDP-N-acetylmuramyl pentapeptide phosphotransferase n=1 Tax=Microbacterium album TaxID=2053191 RepID=UPI001667A8BC|nr:UDP-N-acetylmuramyl pentapeptide phosphotransferase [Microbacterium album]
MTVGHVTARETARSAKAPQQAVNDPARRPDVLLRVRRAPGQEPSAWWFIGAFVAFSGAVTALLSFVPG